MDCTDIVVAVYGMATEAGDVLTKEAAEEMARNYNQNSDFLQCVLEPDNESETKGQVVLRPISPRYIITATEEHKAWIINKLKSVFSKESGA